jgi:hypothetical protein
MNFSGKTLSHHDAVEQILKYQLRYENVKLYVAECDIKKFYDTVNHTIIKKAFKRLIKKVKREQPEVYSVDAERLFLQYLKSYTFNKIVYPLNKNKVFFKKHGFTNSCFAWVEQELKQFYKTITPAKIGIPQGGALSGLIANMVLDYADREILSLADPDLLYVRFCDDMILIHPDMNKCKAALDLYIESMHKLKLIPHPVTIGNLYDKNHWKNKSKGPYAWSACDGCVPWISFVGYEINREGATRVRKSSLNKEMQKQHNVVRETLEAIKNNSHRVNYKSIYESVVKRLIGMSVGRIQLWNYSTAPNDLCWAKGFNLINDNKYSRVQLKRLDCCRNTLLKKLQKAISKLEDKNIKPKMKRESNLYFMESRLVIITM